VKFKLMGLTVVAAVLAVLVIGAAERMKNDAGAARMALAQAIVHARSGLPQFRDRLQHPREHDRAFFVRAEFSSKSGRDEYLWVKDVSLTPDGFAGEIAQQPFLVDLKLDAPVDVPSDRVVDWTIKHDDRSLEGNFTQGLEPGSR